MTAGETLKKARKKAGLTAAQAADKIGFNENMWYKIEAGKRSLKPDYIPRACEVLELTEPELLKAMGMMRRTEFSDGPLDHVIWSRIREDGQSERYMGTRAEYELSLGIREYMGLGPDEYDELFARTIQAMIGGMSLKRAKEALEKYEGEE